MSRILVVEDDLTLRNNICEILECEGFKVESAENGQEAFEKAKNILPDLILSDVMMPKVDGFQLIRLLENEPTTSTIPVIFLTAKVDEEDLRFGMNLGADDYIYKPFRIEELVNSINTRLRKKNLVEQKMKNVKEEISDKFPHELRTPLVPILGYAELIENESDINSIKEMARIIHNSGDLLRNKIDKFLFLKDILLIGKNNFFKKNKNNFSSVLNQELFDEIVLSIPGNLLPAKRIKINSIEETKVEMKETHFQRLLTELIENGLKFSDLDKSVEINSEKSETKINLLVKDYGIGMTEKEINSINSFVKFGKETFRESGFGIGLEIVKKIAALYDINFSIQSSKNNFTICRLELPIC